MTENYIKRIFVEKSRNVENIAIPLSETSRQHLIFTGKNGSGKTSLLLELDKFLSKIDNGEFQSFEQNRNQLKNYRHQISQPNLKEDQKLSLERSIRDYENWIHSFGGTTIEFAGTKNAIFEKSQNGKFILAFFDSTLPN